MGLYISSAGFGTIHPYLAHSGISCVPKAAGLWSAQPQQAGPAARGGAHCVPFSMSLLRPLSVPAWTSVVIMRRMVPK